MSANNKLELMWLGKDDAVNIEPRILIENATLSNNGDKSDNLLIHGDNLLALKALENKYARKVKCIYIDPPYNTGAAFENYDDNLEHSIWLSLMRDRLKILEHLLSDDGGLIFIQIDDNEMAYLKVLCDEIFGRSNFINTIAIKMSPSSGLKRSHKDKGFIKNKEYIHIYSKGEVCIEPLYDEWTKYDSHYSIWFDGTKYDSLFNVIKEKLHIESKLKYDYLLIDDKLNKFVTENSKNIYRTHGPSVWSLENVNNGIELYNDSTLKIIKVTNPKDNNEFELLKSKNNFSGFDRLEPLSWNIIDDKLQTLRGDYWGGFEKDMGNVGKEGGVKMPMSKKPERLIFDILKCCTKKGDLVLDSFLGSGTTAAVAHKMGRKWIGIEMGNHAYTLCKKRLDAVISGKDLTGITARINWKGGGGYKFYELAPSLINIDSFGQPIINKEYNADMLAAAIALHEGFKYQPEKECFWKQSKNDNNTYLYVTTNHVSIELLSRIKSEMKDDEFLMISCKSFDDRAKSFSKNITIKKIPHSLLKNCEFGKDNYNLNIICPPEYEEENDDE